MMLIPADVYRQRARHEYLQQKVVHAASGICPEAQTLQKLGPVGSELKPKAGSVGPRPASLYSPD